MKKLLIITALLALASAAMADGIEPIRLVPLSEQEVALAPTGPPLTLSKATVGLAPDEPDTSNVTIGLIASTGDDQLQLAASYLLHEWTWAELYGDVLWAVKSKRLGWGLSLCSDRTGIKPVDRLLDALYIDGFGVAAYTNPDQKLDWCAYVKAGLYDF